jgi:GNAT superfamily N-acetyltransferase
MEVSMELSWKRDESPRWDEDRARIVGGAPAGVFDARYAAAKIGDQVPGEWWRALDGDVTVGFGWLDVVWGDAEILLATDPDRAGQGVGAFVLSHLEGEAKRRGLNRLYNLVRPTHPEATQVTAWLQKRGFVASEDGSLVRRLEPR